MRREFCEVVTMSEAQAKCPWAAEIAEVEGGFLAFESMDDYNSWAKALSDNCGGDNCCGCEVCTPDDDQSPVKHCNNCDNEAVGFYKTDKGSEFHLCQSCGEAFALGQVNSDKSFTVFSDDDDYERESCDACDSSGQNDDGSECPECKGFGDKIVDKPSWQADNDHDSAKAGIEVAQEALDIQPEDKTTLAYLMFQELDLECTGYEFTECQWDSPVGYECMKVLRKAREFIDLLHDLDSHQDIWSAAFQQCDVFYYG